MLSTKPKSQYEYAYGDNQLTHAHAYLLKPLLSLMPKSPSGQKLRVLDLGCGNGSFTNQIAQCGYEVVGVEESPSGIEIARQQFPDCHFLQGSIYDLPPQVLNNSFDIVISVEVVEHLFYPKELPRVARQCLKPSGKLIITTPYNGYLKNLALAMLGKTDRHFTALWDGGHIKFFSVDTLTKLIEAEGYGNTKFQFAGRMPYLWKSMLAAATLK
jgi:2-polyprenyl-3-methyl-5-hydroxy-6-metoxy-1,4-benzoquinol methylase